MDNILITGHQGLMGSSLVNYLHENNKNQRLIGVSRSRLDDYTMSKLGISNKVTTVLGDIVNYEFVNSVVNRYEINYIYHFSALSIVRTSEHNPLYTFNVNVIGVANILESARQNPSVKGILVSTSDKMYGLSKNLPYKESACFPDPCGVYSTSKICADYIAQMYGKNYNLPVIVFRSANLFGPKDLNFSRLVPGSICKILKNQQPFLWDDVKDYVREFIFVDDMCNILHRLMKVTQTHRGESVNAGSGSIHKVEDFIKRILKVMDKEDLGIQIKKKEIAFKEIPEQYLALNKLKTMIGELPNNTNFDLDGCLRKTVKWYKDYLG